MSDSNEKVPVLSDDEDSLRGWGEPDPIRIILDPIHYVMTPSGDSDGEGNYLNVNNSAIAIPDLNEEPISGHRNSIGARTPNPIINGAHGHDDDTIWVIDNDEVEINRLREYEEFGAVIDRENNEQIDVSIGGNVGSNLNENMTRAGINVDGNDEPNWDEDDERVDIALNGNDVRDDIDLNDYD